MQPCVFVNSMKKVGVILSLRSHSSPLNIQEPKRTIEDPCGIEIGVACPYSSNGEIPTCLLSLKQYFFVRYAK